MSLPVRSGTQSVERAFQLIREVTARANQGARLSDIAAHCGLDRGTTRRLLACLVRERAVGQRTADKRYLPGPLLFELGLALPGYSELQSACREHLARVAHQFEGAAFLSLRSGKEVVCLMREDSIVIQGLWSRIGSRKPLVGTAGGIAILIGLPRDETDAIVGEYLAAMSGDKVKRAGTIRKILQQSRVVGYGINDGELVRGLSSFGVAIHDVDGTPRAAISFVGINGPYTETRRAEIVTALRREAALIEQFAAGSVW